MKSLYLKLMIAGMFLLPQMLSAQSVVEKGDPVMDQTMKDINSAAKENIKAFIGRMGEKFGVSKETVDILLNKNKMEPADAYMTLNVAKIADKPVEEVAESYGKNKKKGWGAIAREMGIKPGSAEFHQLKASAASDSEVGSKEGKKKDKGKKKGKKKGKGKGKNK